MSSWMTSTRPIERVKNTVLTLCFRRHSVASAKTDRLTPEGERFASRFGLSEARAIDNIAALLRTPKISVAIFHSDKNRARNTARLFCEALKQHSKNTSISPPLIDKRLNTFERSRLEKALGRSIKTRDYARWASGRDRLKQAQEAGFEHRGQVQLRFNQILADAMRQAKKAGRGSYTRAYYFSHAGTGRPDTPAGVLEAALEMLSGEKIGEKRGLQGFLEKTTLRTAKENVAPLKNLDGFNVHFVRLADGRLTYELELVRA